MGEWGILRELSQKLVGLVVAFVEAFSVDV